MDTLHVTRAAEGEHWLASTDVTTIRALGFEAVPGGTRFTYTLEGDTSGVLLLRVMGPILTRL